MRIASYKIKSYCFGKNPKFILWTQGCPNACDGCIAPEWQTTTGGFYMSAYEIYNLILINSLNDIVISGGEPLLQYDELCLVMKALKKENLGIILYTGFLWEEINKFYFQVLELSDLIISGPYIEKLNNGKGLRGSKNQELHFLSSRYKDEKEYFQFGKRMLEVDINKDSLSFCGIPPLDADVLL